jgi:type II secretory pathway pseudopilin PulG
MTELLVVMVLASAIMSGLMYLVVELLTTNQRESSLNETQRDMQNALDYISSELREAVYIYPGECLTGTGAGPTDPTFCPGLAARLPNAVTNSAVPVLAFWKLEDLPDQVREACANSPASVPVGTNCVSGHSYSLVVYSLSTADPNDIWDGNARITRYELSEFGSTGLARNQGYVSPGGDQPFFRTWPFQNGIDLSTGAMAGQPQVLVDFVDDGSGQTESYTAASEASCPTGYSVSPPDGLLGARGFAGVRSFYSCVQTTDDAGVNITLADNPDTLVYLRGNANGRPGILNENVFMTGLETRVISRNAFQRRAGGD